jgi:alkylation response protein AidB-like acyl-CoA dehydrogenase
MDFELSEEQRAYQDAARGFAEKELWPKATEWDEKKFFPVEVIKRAGELGFCGIYIREDVGGLNLGRLNAAIIFEELAMGCPSTTAYITIHNMCTWMVDQFGKSTLRKSIVPAMASGQKLASYCLTEPWSGSDAASLKATAVRKGQQYILNGTKSFISGAGSTDYYVVMARTGEPGPKGISTFVVPATTPGLSFGENEKKMGWNCQPTRIVNLENVIVPEDHLLGEEGQGFKIAMQGLDGGRINIGICSVGAATAALRESIRYLGERKQFGKELNQFQALQFKIADMSTELVAARNLVRMAAFKLDKKHPDANVFCAMAKRFATDVGWKICDDAIQLFGGYGYTREYPLERLMRDTRVHRILEGTNEVMNLIISRRMLQDASSALELQ